MRLVLHRITAHCFSSAKTPFLKLVTAPIGIQEPILEVDKEKINKEITERMQELEGTGLSREEIILSKSQKGLPLRIDPFFQFLKNNLKAREIYLKGSDRFTVANVISIALRQDIGPDQSYARVRDGGQLTTKGRAQYLNNIPEADRTAFDPKAYYSEEQFSIDKAFDELKPKQAMRHYYKPVDRYNKMQMNLRKLKKYDIHWRNIELLRQFMTINSSIKSRMSNMLSVADQKKVVRAIKTARQMAALPYTGRSPQAIKRNITDLQDQVKEIGVQHVDLETGHIYFSRPQSMDSVELEIATTNKLNNKYESMVTSGKSYKLWVSALDSEIYEPKGEVTEESYAKFLKQESNPKTEKEDVGMILRRVTGLRPDREDPSRVVPSASEEAQKLYNQKKHKLLKMFQSDPQKIAAILLQEKMKVEEY